jgi:hypothetical protein
MVMRCATFGNFRYELGMQTKRCCIGLFTIGYHSPIHLYLVLDTLDTTQGSSEMASILSTGLRSGRSLSMGVQEFELIW